MKLRIKLVVGAVCVWLSSACVSENLPIATERQLLEQEGAAGSAPVRGVEPDAGKAPDAGGPVRGSATAGDTGAAPDAGRSDDGRSGTCAPPVVGVPTSPDAGAPEPGRPSAEDAGYPAPQPVDAGGYANFGDRLASIDSDPCTIEQCHDTRCETVRVAPGERDADVDEDGVVAGCGGSLDCWDSNDRVHPGQESFFADGFAHGSFLDWDYDCNDQLERQYTVRFTQCEVAGTNTCEGQGWAIGESEAPPACGVAANYLACRFVEGECVAQRITLTQRCR